VPGPRRQPLAFVRVRSYVRHGARNLLHQLYRRLGSGTISLAAMTTLSCSNMHHPRVGNGRLLLLPDSFDISCLAPGHHEPLPRMKNSRLPHLCLLKLSVRCEAFRCDAFNTCALVRPMLFASDASDGSMAVLRLVRHGVTCAFSALTTATTSPPPQTAAAGGDHTEIIQSFACEACALRLQPFPDPALGHLIPFHHLVAESQMYAQQNLGSQSANCSA
jgi:hypothetical protein